ncbi:MAG TPA: hypothetical protein VHD61_15605 [Lacunisphaera sp.]|nr:hypothetical protein [Lacunisphaera sp.]
MLSKLPRDREGVVKAISLWQPWASALFTPLKKFETRHWPVPRSIIGQRVCIHAAKKRDADVRDFWETLDSDELAEFTKIGIASFDQLPFGAIIGQLDLVECHRTEDLRVQPGTHDYEWGNHAPGRFAWECANAARLPRPVPCVGRQGFFDVESQLRPFANPS